MRIGRALVPDNAKVGAPCAAVDKRQFDDRCARAPAEPSAATAVQMLVRVVRVRPNLMILLCSSNDTVELRPLTYRQREAICMGYVNGRSLVRGHGGNPVAERKLCAGSLCVCSTTTISWILERERHS
jgi:hypothetical protein